MFDKGDDPLDGIVSFARARDGVAAHLTGIGAFSDFVVGYLDRGREEYARIAIDEQVEVLSLAGYVAFDECRELQVHAHVVVGKADGSAHGGHLLEATSGRPWKCWRRCPCRCASGSTPRPTLRASPHRADRGRAARGRRRRDA